MTTPTAIPTDIQWPDHVDEARFLSDYWQQKPLLIRQAFPNFQTPISADELAGLAIEPDTTPRLIIEEPTGYYQLEHGPFHEDRFSELNTSNWSLLVTDAEKHEPYLNQYLSPFRFLPSWRIDDLMISYAPVGASVGAHVDEYDVFLLQASGHREWSIDTRSDAEHTWNTKSDLKLVDNFSANEQWVLQPGDMLYLPPGIAHHGVACKDECTTWSIGFRAPAIPDLILRLAEIIAEDTPDNRFRDGPLKPAVSGEIDQSAFAQFKSLWLKAVSLSDEKFANLIGEFVTESGLAEDPVLDQQPDEGSTFDASVPLRKASFSRMAWHQSSPLATRTMEYETVSLFVNGEHYVCSLHLAKLLCGNDVIVPAEVQNIADQQLLETLWRAQLLVTNQ